MTLPPAYDPWGNPVENPLSPEALRQQAIRDLEQSDLPPSTGETRSFAGIFPNDSEWFTAIAVYGPKDLGMGPVYAVECSRTNGVVECIYFGGLLGSRVRDMQTYLNAGVGMEFCYSYHQPEMDGKREVKRGFYTMKIRVLPLEAAQLTEGNNES